MEWDRFSPNPFSQEFNKTVQSNYARNLAETQEKMVQDQIRGAAEVGAQEFAQFGPRGQELAQRLMADPRGTVAYIESMGGFDAVMGQLRYGQAVGDATEQGMMLDPLQQTALIQGGAQEYNLLQDAQPETLKPTLRSGPNQVQYVFDPATGTMQRIPGQADPIVSGVGPGGIDVVSARTLRNDYTTGAKDFIVQRDYYEAAQAALTQAAKDPTSPGATDFALVQAYGKMLDPNSVVRNEEGKFIVESQSSFVQDKINAFTRLLSSAGTLNPTARLNLIKQIEAQYRQAESRHMRYLGEVDQEISQLSTDPTLQNLARPIGLEPSALTIDLAPWEEAAGETFTNAQGVKFKKNADGTYDEVE
jgi:hypothetical protein